MTADPDKQWRIDNAEHLRGVRLKLQAYVQWRDDWDHDHCAGCWAKFAMFEGPDILHQGYATMSDYPKGERYAWVCASCVADLREDMGWVLES
jgi:hypothetical protein